MNRAIHKGACGATAGGMNKDILGAAYPRFYMPCVSADVPVHIFLGLGWRVVCVELGIGQMGVCWYWLKI